jgi:tellurite resistance protein
MEPTYLEEKTRHADIMKRLLYSAGLSVAAADGKVQDEEAAEMFRIAGALGVPPILVSQTIAGAASPMD